MSMPGPLCDIVIVNWNSGRFLKECLHSVASYGSSVAKVVVVDNGSVDGSDAVDGMLDNLELIRAGTNLGFAKACNLGAAQSSAPYILFLNPDARLFEGSVSRAVAFMESDRARAVGICGIRLVDETGTTQVSCMNFPRVGTFFGQATGLDRLFPASSTWLFAQFDYSKSRVVDQVIGAFFLIRAPLFRELGGFDERFFVYLEEVDLSLRAKEKGWDSYYFAPAVAFHHGGGTTEQVKALRLFYLLRSRLLYGFKHYSSLAGWALVLISMGIEPVARLGRSLVRLAPRDALNTIRAYGMLIRDFPSLAATSRRLNRRTGRRDNSLNSWER